MRKPARILIDALTEPAFTLEQGPSGAPVFTLCNTAWFDMNHRTHDTVYGRTVAEVFPGVPGQNLLSYHQQAFRTAHPIVYHVLVPVGGKMRKMKMQLTPMLKADGEVAYVFGTSQDVTNNDRIDVMELQYSKLAKEIELLTAYLSNDLLNHLHRVAEVSESLREGFVDLGDGKLQELEGMGNSAKTATSMICEVMDYAKLMRVASQTETFLLFDMFTEELAEAAPGLQAEVNCGAPALLAEGETLRVILRNLLAGCAPERLSDESVFELSAETDCPGMIAISVSVPRNVFDRAFSMLNTPAAQSGTRIKAIQTFQDLVQSRGGEFFAEHTGVRDVVQFTIPGYLRERDLVGALSA